MSNAPRLEAQQAILYYSTGLINLQMFKKRISHFEIQPKSGARVTLRLSDIKLD